MNHPIGIGNLELYVGVSIGVSIAPLHDTEVDELILKADMALYEAKALGKGQWVMFKSEMEERAARRSQLEIDMRAGISKEEFFTEYQPQVGIAGKALVGFEALMRWDHPYFGSLSPIEFIPIAEETGMIVELSEKLIEDACLAATKWPTVNGENCTISVNISPVQFLRSDVYQTLKDILDRTQLDPKLLEIEITESVLIQDVTVTKDVLLKVASLGVKIAIDDFGTGYSSLGYLQEFPLDRLKVDRCFVTEIENNPSSQRISKAIVDLGRSMGLEVIAEGVETEGQRSYLESLSCDQIQGYLYSPPVSLTGVLNIIMKANEAARQETKNSSGAVEAYSDIA